MQFNGHTDNQDLVSDTRFLVFGDYSNTSYSTKDIARNISERFKIVWTWIFEAYGGWQFIDDNTSSTSSPPYSEQDLVSGTSVYGLPSQALTVNGVEIKDSSGTWHNLEPITYEQIRSIEPVDEFNSSNGLPTYYALRGDVIEIFPAPNYDSTNGLRVYFDESISEFSSSDTTKTPGFASIFHRVLSVGAALDYLIANAMDERKIARLEQLWLRYEIQIKKFYAKRFKERFPSRINVNDPLPIYE